MARSKDYWVYQEKREQLPWVIHIIVTKEGRKVTADFDFFAEWLNCDSKRFTVENVPLYRTDNGADAIVEEVKRICIAHEKEFSPQDEQLIKDDIKLMMSDF